MHEVVIQHISDGAWAPAYTNSVPVEIYAKYCGVSSFFICFDEHVRFRILCHMNDGSISESSHGTER